MLSTMIFLLKKWSEQIKLGKSTENSSGRKFLHLTATMSFFGLKKVALLLFELLLQESTLQLFLTGIMQITSSEIVTNHYNLMIFLLCGEFNGNAPHQTLYIRPIYKCQYTGFYILCVQEVVTHFM